MPLLDHFHEPLDELLPWESVGFLWVGQVVGLLNRTLPKDEYRAFASIHLGSKAEADVAEYEVGDGSVRNGTAVAMAAAPPAVATIPAIFPDELEVQVSERRRSLRLSAVVEFV